MERYILLLHEPAIQPGMSPQEMQAIVARYKAWSERLGAQGRIAGGNKLEDGTGRVMRGKGDGLRITDGPYVETKDVVAGFFVLQASSYEEAVEFSKECPHLDFGTIEVRRVEI